MTTVRSRRELASLPISALVTARGKELAATDTVAKARRLFANESVQVLPVIDGTAYLGALERDALPDDLSPETPVAAIASRTLQTTLAATPSGQALAELDRAGVTRLVVLEDDGFTYRGLVCLRSDRRRVCVDAECHDGNATEIEERTYA